MQVARVIHILCITNPRLHAVTRRFRVWAAQPPCAEKIRHHTGSTFSGEVIHAPVTARDWRDRVQWRVGVENTSLLKPVVLRFGYSYDPTPVPNSTLDPLLLDLTRHTTSAGIGISRKDWTVDLLYEHSFAVQRTVIDSIHPFPTNGTYDGSVDVVVITVGRRL